VLAGNQTWLSSLTRQTSRIFAEFSYISGFAETPT
jgi:hypothetical protein